MRGCRKCSCCVRVLMLNILKNIADISLVAYLIYRLLLLIKGTRAMQVLWGLIFLAFLAIFARLADFKGTAFLLQQFWVAGIIVLFIVFQPEIRAGLAALGSRPLGRILESHEFDFIKETMDAVRFGAKKRMGMLIVLEQEIGLRDIVKSGVTVNGAVSCDLLISIFFPKTPLHDGAVVIAGNRLMAAGCILPLTQEAGLSTIFGMRHRAAIGITETCDAIVLVVSEESGKVSLVRGGKIQTPVDPDDVENSLLDLYRSKAEKRLLRKAPRAQI